MGARPRDRVAASDAAALYGPDHRVATSPGHGDDASDAPLRYLWTTELDPLFWRLARTGVVSAWAGHVPFGHWIVRATGPRVLVELGTEWGVSYSAFCEAVARDQLDTRCFAVDTWRGDEHSGLYDEHVYADLCRFHEARYGAFSRLLRCTFDEALPHLPDNSIDLLHIDGLHTYAAVRHDYDSWLPKLSDRGVVLLHDINVREREFGVWRLWEELRARHPSFEFLHSHGLGILAVGTTPPAAVASLCALQDARKISAVRQRFALLGERWEAEIQQKQLTEAKKELTEAKKELTEQGAHRSQRQTPGSPGRMGPALRRIRAPRQRVEAARAAAEAEAARAAAEAEAARAAAEAEAARAVAEATEAARRAEAAGARARAAEAELSRTETILHDFAKRYFDSPGRRWRAATKRALKSVGSSFSPRARRARRQLLRDGKKVLKSPLFDVGWYAAGQRKLKGDRLDIALYYVRKGAAKRRNPSRYFDAAWYLTRYPDVAASGINPLLHYIKHGRTERREIRPVFDSSLTQPEGHRDRGFKPHRARRMDFGRTGHARPFYRVARHAEAAAPDIITSWMRIDEVPHRCDEITDADILVLWRAAWDERVATVIDLARRAGVRVVFDVDDLMFEPDLARVSVIDGIRSQHLTEQQVRDHYARVRSTMLSANMVTTATEELATHARRLGLPALVLPNGYDEATYRRSRLAVRRRKKPDSVVRIGYAGGSRTHQRDFAVAADAIAQVLRDRPETRLVLFRDAKGLTPILDIEEFPALRGLEDRIEWRNFVPLSRLPEEIAQFDINIAPLEVGNPFCEAKSELKFFESALVDVPTIASPTGPFRRAIRHGVTGFLAADTAQWLEAAIALVDEPALRYRIARAAHREVLWTYGPLRRSEAMASALPLMLRKPQGVRSSLRSGVVPKRRTPSAAVDARDGGGLSCGQARGSRSHRRRSTLQLRQLHRGSPGTR